MPNTIVVNYKCASKARTLFGRIGLWLADGQVPGSVDLVRLARSRSQPARSPRRCRPDRQADRGWECCTACGGTRSAWTGTRPAPWPRRRTGAGHHGRGAMAAAQCRARRRGLRRRHRRPRPELRPPGDRGGPQWAPGRRRPRSPRPPWRPLEAYLADRAHSARAARLAAADGVPAGHRRRAAPPGSLLGAGALPVPPRRDRRVGAALAALPACSRSLSPWTPGPPCATSRVTPAQRPPAPPAGMITPATAWTATPPTPSPPTWRISIAELARSAPARQASPAAGIPATSAGTSQVSP